MKKLLIGLTVLFSFIFVSNVKAENIPFDVHHIFEYTSFTNTANLSNEEVINLLTNAGKTEDYINGYITMRNYRIEKNNDGKYYFYSPSSSSEPTGRLFINLNNESPINGYFSISYSVSSNITGIYMNIQYSSSDYSYYNLNKVNNEYSVKYSSSSGWLASNHNPIKIFLNSNNSYIEDGYDMYLSYFYETNMSFDMSYKQGNQRFNEDLIINDVNYPINSILPISIENGFNSLIPQGPTEPQLQYKNSFVSNENYNVIGKITNEFDLYENNFVTTFKNIKFKLQYGANDFLKENIPIFSRFKIYGKRDENSQWYDFQDYLDNNNFISMEILENKFDYSENMLADASIIFQLNFPNIEDFDILCPDYRYFKIEFYFDNLNNGYIYTADNLNNSNWYKTDKFLENYKFYYFPSDYKYAFITSNNEYNKGKIFYPTNAIKNDFINLQGQYYDFKNKIFTMPIYNNTYENDDYYSYLEFEFNDKNNILVLNRAIGKYKYTNYYCDSIIDDFKLYIDLGLTYTTLFLNQKNYGFTLFPTEYINSELTYFYVPIEYNVYFTNEEDITINKSDGDITINIKDSNNSFESEITYDKNNNIYNNLNDLNINSNFGDYFNYVYNNLINSEIGRYITLLIIFAFIIIIIVAA